MSDLPSLAREGYMPEDNAEDFADQGELYEASTSKPAPNSVNTILLDSPREGHRQRRP